jgi:hypothetical protein
MNYVVNLKKSFNNVIKIELVSSEFPYVDIVIQKNINDKLYWKNIEDGEYIYNITIDEGFYSSDTFLEKLQSLMNSIPRYNYSDINQIYNNFDIILESNIQKITFIPYNFINLDIQGAELKALKGMEEYLPNIDYIYTEVNNDQVYKGCNVVTEIDEYLKTFGFHRVETSWCENYRWGDAFYCKI